MMRISADPAALHSLAESCTTVPKKSSCSPNRLTCGDADAHVQMGRHRYAVIFGDLTLNIDCSSQPIGDLGEYGHDFVAGVLDLMTMPALQRSPDDQIMALHQFHRRFIAQRLSGFDG